VRWRHATERTISPRLARDLPSVGSCGLPSILWIMAELPHDDPLVRLSLGQSELAKTRAVRYPAVAANAVRVVPQQRSAIVTVTGQFRSVA
jgi:hypothetical protein